MNPNQKTYDVIILGGGITGAGTARDCALRGLSVLLIEKGDLSNGATGRNHGLLHSGARYAVTDGESAAECIEENLILKRIAPHCVEDTSGLFITLPEDDLAYQQGFVDSCLKAGIEARVMDPKEAIAMEPSVNPDIIGAVKVPDGSVDPFKLCACNVFDARVHGADVLIYNDVVAIVKDGYNVVGVKVRSSRTGEENEFRASVIVNACGIWAKEVAQMAGTDINLYPAKGAMLIYSRRVNKMAINRCRKPANADILVPGGPVTVIGTTSSRIPFEECDRPSVTAEEVNELVLEGQKLAPVLASTRILRAYAGVRPLVAAEDDPTGRSLSRGFVCLDHLKRDGIGGFISIIGGKLTSYRLMAEKTTDLVCEKLGVNTVCSTAETMLVDYTAADCVHPANMRKLSSEQVAEAMYKTKAIENQMLCECERISAGEVRDYFVRDGVEGLSGLKRRCRFGMGVCQGIICACRASSILLEVKKDPEAVREDLRYFMNERWKGDFPIAWGEALRESEMTQWVDSQLLGTDQ